MSEPIMLIPPAVSDMDAVAEHDPPWPMQDYIYKRDGRICQYCGDPNPRVFVMEHVIPWSQGGHTAPYNLVVACGSCNNSKRSQVWVPDNIDILYRENQGWAEQIEALAEKYPRADCAVYLPFETAQWLRQTARAKDWRINGADSIVDRAVWHFLNQHHMWVEEPPMGYCEPLPPAAALESEAAA